MKIDYREANLDAPDQALCAFALKLTLRPGDSRESDVASLRSHGFSDEEISIAAQVIGYFNYINRIADGLGVDPEDWMTPCPEDWRSRKTSLQEWIAACPTD